jgi:hypothetical protein
VLQVWKQEIGKAKGLSAPLRIFKYFFPVNICVSQTIVKLFQLTIYIHWCTQFAHETSLILHCASKIWRWALGRDLWGEVFTHFKSLLQHSPRYWGRKTEIPKSLVPLLGFDPVVNAKVLNLCALVTSSVRTPSRSVASINYDVITERGKEIGVELGTDASVAGTPRHRNSVQSII